ncbi:PAS domain S-box protein [Haloferax sp. YSMS24]|uniref:PAS domain S-box protein n=1 Tax=Haloferax sp. YSMS24 TaxID=3388425 RepID=UPI00398D1BF6
MAGRQGGWKDETLAVFEETSGTGEPLTTQEVTEHLDCTRRTVYNRLQRLVDDGLLATKKVGARGRIWWRVPQEASTDAFEVTSDGVGTTDTAREAQFNSLVEEVSEYAIFALDTDGRVVTWNRGAERIKGYDAAEIVGEHFSIFYPTAATRAGVPERNLADAAREGTTKDEGWRIRKDGSRFRAKITLTAITEGGEIRGYVKVTQDITRQYRNRQRLAKQRDELERELDDVFERIDDGFLAVDEELHCVYVNERAATLLEREAAELYGETLWNSAEPERLAEFRDGFEHVLATGDPVTCESYLDDEGRWLTATIYPSEHGLSVYLRDVTERRERNRELEQYETIVETIDDGVYVLDEDSHFVMVNESFQEMMGYDRSELLGEHASFVVGEETAREAVARRRLMGDDERYATLEAKIERADGSHFFAESKFTHLPSSDDGDDADDSFVGSVGVVRDTTERRRYEAELERQREQLAALNDLNGVIRQVTDAVIAQSTREEVESVVCDRLADAETYQFAWIGELDRSLDTVRVKATSGRDSIEGIELSLDAEADTGFAFGTLVAEALRTQTVQYRRGIDDVDYETTADGETDRGFDDILAAMNVQSSVAIPIVHEETVLGVLMISTYRPDAFEGDEQATIDHLGAIIGHAIASIERKRALMSEEVIEVQFRIDDFSASLGIPLEMDGTISIDEIVEISDGTFTSFGTVTDDAVDALEAIFEATPDWEKLTLRNSDDGTNTFEVKHSEPPVASAVAGQGGEISEARIEDGTVHLGFYLPPGADVRKIIELVESEYPETEMVSRRQVKRPNPQLRDVLTEKLTDRQRSTIEACFHAGFFEWPRTSSGEEVADSLGISPATFHQHLRAAERKVFEALLS